MADAMNLVHVKGDELMTELLKLQTSTEQGVALDLLQQLMNGIMSTYTLARFTVKAFVVQDSYTASGEKKTLEHIAEVLRFLVKPKSEITSDDTRDMANGKADSNHKPDKSDDATDLPSRDDLSQALAAYAKEGIEDDGEANSDGEEEKNSDKDDSEDDNIDDEDYKPAGKVGKDVKGAKKRKQGFKLRIRQSARKAGQVDEGKDSVSEESTKEEKVKPKRANKRRKKSGKKMTALPAKKRRQTDEIVQYAMNVHCFICEDENIKYPTEDEFFEHCVKEHVDHSCDDKVVLPCSKCDKSFRVSGVKGTKSYMRTPVYTLLNHLVEKHGSMRPEWAPVYKCKNCSHTTLVRSFLPHHEKTCGQVVPTVTCEFCGMMLKKNSLYLHIKRCSNPGSKVATYKCEECNKMYLTQAILDIHVKRMHKKEASHLCTECTQTFFAKVDLERHMFVHHGVNISRMKVVPCPICDFQTLEGSLMRKHMKNHDIGSHPCEFCGRIFGTMNRLRMHRLTHTAERKHKCPHCTYTAIRSFHLQRHIAVRHLGSPFKCTRCTFSTTSTKNLRRHMRKSHKCDELTAIEETSNIPENNLVDNLYPTISRKRRITEVQPENIKLPVNAIDDQMPLRQDELKEAPNVAAVQMVVAAGNSNENAMQQQIASAQHHTETTQQQLQQHQRQQQQQQQAVAVAAVEQAAGPSYIQPLFTTTYGVPYHMQVAAPVGMPATANAEHTSFLRHVLGQKMSVVPSNIQHDQQQDPNSLYNIHYDQQQHQVVPSVIPDQPQQQQQPQPQQSYAPQ